MPSDVRCARLSMEVVRANGEWVQTHSFLSVARLCCGRQRDGRGVIVSDGRRGPMNERLIAELAQMAGDVADRLGLEVVDVELVKEAGVHFLRFFIDKPGGVFLDDCEAFHRAIDPLLDERDPISHAYNLEVASPGLDRPLKRDADFARFAGESVQVRCYEPWDGKRQWHGRLVGLSGDDVVIAVAEGELRIPRGKISRVRLDPEF